MEVSICIDYEDYIAHQTQWDYALMNFPVNTIYVHNVDSKETLRGRVIEGATYLESVSELPQDSLVVLSPKKAKFVPGEHALSSFDHPDNVVYYFGSNSEYLLKEYFVDRKPDHLVYIDLASHFDMWSWMAWAIVAYDRITKIRDR